MAKKKINKEKSGIKKRKSMLESNWILGVTIAVVAVPILIVGFMLLTSVENSGEPVTGKRFENQLEPAIKEEQLKQLKETLVYDGVDAVEVNLKSATLRISIDVNDAMDEATLVGIMNDAHAKVDAILPVATYFTNQEKVKMYDLEISVFNFVADDTNRAAQIYGILHKNAAAAEAAVDWKSKPRNDEVTNSLLNPGV